MRPPNPAPPNLKIETFQSASAQALIASINSVCANSLWMSDHYEATPDWEHALNDDNCPHHLLSVAKIEGQIIGWCKLFPIADNPGALELGIGVLPPYQRQGVGTALLAKALDWAKTKRATKITLIAHADNVPARRLFERFSFVVRERRKVWLRMRLKTKPRN